MFKLQLRNGHEVLDWRLRPGRPGEKPLIGVVLVDMGPDDYHDRYVTWEVGTESDELFDAGSGHYFVTLDEARENFRVRTWQL